MSTMSPNMSLVISTIGIDTGLQWEQNLNSSLSIIDGHNHTSGNGVPIPPSGLNINTDLSFAGNQATNMKAVLFKDQSSLATLNALYTIGGELYFNDGSGVVQITLGGAVNATASGISSGSASAAFSGGVLVVLAAALTPANIKGASLLMGNNSSGTHYLTLAPPAAMASDFSIILPTLPASQKIMTLDASGNMAAPYTVDNSTLAISSNQLIVKSAGITSTQLASGAALSNIASGSITNVKLAAAATGVTSGSGSFSSSSGTDVAIDHLDLTFSGTGRPVVIVLQGVQGSTSSIQMADSSGSGPSLLISIYKAGSVLTSVSVIGEVANGSITLPPSIVSYIDLNGSTSSEYIIKARAVNAGTFAFTNVTLAMYEIK